MRGTKVGEDEVEEPAQLLEARLSAHGKTFDQKPFLRRCEANHSDVDPFLLAHEYR